MGLFDGFIKNIDNVLSDIESGKLEDRLTNLADKLDHTSKTVVKTTEKLADKPAGVLRQAEQKAELVKQHAQKSMDIISKQG